MKGKIIAIHSSRGGTGKTTIATNLALNYANNGLNVALLDLDFRAPSLFSVFSKRIKTPVHWLNDFMVDRCTLEQSLIDASECFDTRGSLLLGLANPTLEAIRKVTGRSRSWEVSAAKKLFSIRKTLFDKKHIDYCIIDTSPGIQYSSINAVVSSDVAVVVVTLNPVDIEGVKKMLSEVYDEFEKKPWVLINKAYPQTRMWSSIKRAELAGQIEKVLEHPVIGVIPCYCDVLEPKNGTFLMMGNPNHPFFNDLQEVANKLEDM
ncbi:MAG: ParA family protein [Candidatus Bathyarchaeota archaeon]|nr:ParA family protein [Candidatus Bathyarchaeum sp.]